MKDPNLISLLIKTVAQRRLAVCPLLIWVGWNAFAQTPTSLLTFPTPDKIFQNDKQFDAMSLGPGNTVSIHEPPRDLQLDSFDFSSDGALLFMSWDSGRVEVGDMQTGNRVAQFKPMKGPVLEVVTNDAIKDWVFVGQHGLVRFVNPQSGKTAREIHTEIGRFKYDVQKVLVAPDGSWLAYVNQENGKVLDLRSDPPKVLANLEDAYDIALSPDNSQMWAVNRKSIFGIAIPQWTRIGTAPLIDQVRPDSSPMLAIVDGEEGAIAFVSSKSGLLSYDLRTIHGTKVTQNPAYLAYSTGLRGPVLVNELGATSMYANDGSLLCQWKLHGARELKISSNGEWLGGLMFPKAEVWDLRKLLASCPKRP